MSWSEVTEWLGRVVGLSTEAQLKVAVSALVVTILWLLRLVLLKAVERRSDDVRVHYRWKKALTYSLFLVGFLLVGRIWFEGFSSLATFLGLLSAGLAIALKDPLVNLAGWGFILWRRPFEVGDRVQLGESAGDVIDLRLFQFTLVEIGNWVHADQSTGRIIHIPNGQIFTLSLANYTRGFQFIWNELPVLVTFESNWREAKRIFQEVADRHSEHLSKGAEEAIRKAARRYMIFYQKLTPRVYTSVEDSGVLLTIRYLCPARERRGTAEAIWEEILEELAQRDDIDFAYPTWRLYDNRKEGKAGTQPAEPE